VWASYNAATNGAVLIGNGVDITSDTTPTFVAVVTLDDGVGDSPTLAFVGGSNDDTARLVLADDAVAGNSDFYIRLCADDADSQFQIRNATGAPVAWIDATGDANLSDVTIDEYIIHDGDADTYFRYQDDRITLRAGGADLLDLVEAATDYVLFGAMADLNNNDLIIDTDGDTYLHASADDVISIAIANNEQYDFDATELTLSTTGGTEILWIRTHGDVTNTGADIYANANFGAAADDSVYMFIDANSSDTSAEFVVAKDADTMSGATSLMRVTEAPKLFLNETAESDITVGMCLNQAANDDYIATFKSSDVGHPMTDYAELDTYGSFNKAAAAAGGLQIRGFRDADADNWKALALAGFLGEAADTTKTTAGHGVVAITAWVTNGGTSIQAVGADGNLFSIENGSTTRFLFDAEGSAHADVEWTTFDQHDDLALLDGLEASFGQFADEHKRELEALGIAHFDSTPGHAMVNWTRLAMLQTGALRQIGKRLASYERAFAALGVNPALLEA